MLEVTLSSKDGFTVASTKGILDEFAREPFREKLHPLVGQKGTRLIVDLAGSQRVNSPGLGNLVALNADAEVMRYITGRATDPAEVRDRFLPEYLAVPNITASDLAAQTLVDLEVALCEQPGLVDAGGHLLAVARKP